MTIKLHVFGSRHFKPCEIIPAVLDTIHKYRPITQIVEGGANGPDTESHLWAKAKNIDNNTIKPDWKKGPFVKTASGRTINLAGIQRNTELVENGEYSLGFWDLRSGGTRDTIKKAKKAGKLIGFYDDDCKFHPGPAFDGFKDILPLWGIAQ